MELHFAWNCVVVGSILFSLSSVSFSDAFAFAAGMGDVAVLKASDYVVADVWMSAFAMGFALWRSILCECFCVRKPTS